MTLDQFGTVIKSADPAAAHYAGKGTGNYTRWYEYDLGDNGGKSGPMKIQVDHFTKLENDPVVTGITEALNLDDVYAKHLVDFEPDTGYIHHIWDCEVT